MLYWLSVITARLLSEAAGMGFYSKAMNMSDMMRMNRRIAMYLTKTLVRLSDEACNAIKAELEEFNIEPHPHLLLTMPFRHVGTIPQYTTDAAAAMQVLKLCMEKLDEWTKRTDCQIVVLYDEGHPEPYAVMTDGGPEGEESFHLNRIGNGQTLQIAICRFALKLYDERPITAAELVAEIEAITKKRKKSKP